MQTVAFLCSPATEIESRGWPAPLARVKPSRRPFPIAGWTEQAAQTDATDGTQTETPDTNRTLQQKVLPLVIKRLRLNAGSGMKGPIQRSALMSANRLLIYI